MMNSTFQETILSHGECLLAWRYDSILPCYREVLPVFVDGKAILLDSHKALRVALGNLRKRLLKEGVIRSTGTVISCEQTERKRFHFVVEWHYFIDTTNNPRTSSTTYYCVQHDGKILVEMVEYKKLAVPDIAGWDRLDIASPKSNDDANTGYLH